MSTGPRLPAEVLRIIAESLWADIPVSGEDDLKGGEADELAAEAFVHLSCANRQLSELCRPLRWEVVEVDSLATVGNARRALEFPAVIEHVRRLVIRVPLNQHGERIRLLQRDVDVLIALLGNLTDLTHFELALDIEIGDGAADEADIAAGAAVMWRLVDVFSQLTRPHLLALALCGGYGQGVEHVFEVSAAAVGRIISRSPRLDAIDLESIQLVGRSLEVAPDAQVRRLARFCGINLVCSSDTAIELGKLIGPWTKDLSTDSTAWATQMTLLGGGVVNTERVCEGLRWMVAGDHSMDEDMSSNFEALVQSFVSAHPGLEAVYGPTPSDVLVHAAGDRSRRFHDESAGFTLGVIANRLADPTYGRALTRITVSHDNRDTQLEKICSARGIRISY